MQINRHRHELHTKKNLVKSSFAIDLLCTRVAGRFTVKLLKCKFLMFTARQRKLTNDLQIVYYGCRATNINLCVPKIYYIIDKMCLFFDLNYENNIFLDFNVIYFISDYAIHVEHLFQCLIVLILSSFISCDDFQASLSTRPAITLIPVVFFRHKNHKNKITYTHTHTHTD